MKLYNLVITRKSTGEKSVLEHNITEAKAEKTCEQWGWMYDDGNYSYYMGYEETSVTTEMLETIADSFLADLQDALEIETDENVLHAIQSEIEKRIDNKPC